MPCTLGVLRVSELAALFGRFLRLYTDAVRTRGGLPQPRALTLTGFTLRGLPPCVTCRVTVSQRRMCMPAEADGPACGEAMRAPPGASGAPAYARRAAPGPAAVAACAGPHAVFLAAVQVVSDAGGRAGACLQGCVVQGEVKVLVRAHCRGLHYWVISCSNPFTYLTLT